jgi:hypothetical protein
MRPYLKTTKSKKRLEGTTQLVVHLSSKHRVLSSNPSIAKEKFLQRCKFCQLEAPCMK